MRTLEVFLGIILLIFTLTGLILLHVYRILLFGVFGYVLFETIPGILLSFGLSSYLIYFGIKEESGKDTLYFFCIMIGLAILIVTIVFCVIGFFGLMFFIGGFACGFPLLSFGLRGLSKDKKNQNEIIYPQEPLEEQPPKRRDYI